MQKGRQLLPPLQPFSSASPTRTMLSRSSPAASATTLAPSRLTGQAGIPGNEGFSGVSSLRTRFGWGHGANHILSH